jgi:hypothetical protein
MNVVSHSLKQENIWFALTSDAVPFSIRHVDKRMDMDMISRKSHIFSRPRTIFKLFSDSARFYSIIVLNCR